MRPCRLGMPLKTISFKFFPLLISIFVLTSCTTSIPFISSPTEKNVLTGKTGSNGKILAVKIDDTPPAHPQIGIAAADVIYIEQVEGGLTRLAAIYTSNYPEKIGPVRSARISDLDILAGYGKVAFAYSGAQSKFIPKIKAANLVDLGAEHEPATIYSRDLSRSEPTNMILNAPALLEKAASENNNPETVKSVGWNFGVTPKGGREILSAKVKWPASNYTFIWSPKEKRWLIDYLGQPDLDANGLQLGEKTILIQLVSITDSEYHDKVGGVTPFSNTVGVGFGYLLRDGKSFKITWKRDNPEAGTSFSLEDGSEAKFAPGQIWIALTDKAPTFSYPPSTNQATNETTNKKGVETSPAKSK